MADVWSVAGGNWNANAATVWNGGVVPTAGQTVQISAGHTVTVDGEINAISTCTVNNTAVLKPGFQMSTSAFASIVVDSGGKLYASRTASSLLRVAGTITANGTNSVDYGTSGDPISNPAVGAFIEFVCTSDGQASRGINTGITNAVTFYGATRVMTSTLAALANIGDTSIVLADDMALRLGTIAQWSNGLADMILVGHTPVQTNNGAQNDEMDIYLVGNYVAGTKTVTLADAGVGQSYWPRGGTTPNWNNIHQTARQIGTPVYLLAANVGIRGSAYNLRPTSAINCGVTHAIGLTNAMLAWDFVGIENGTGAILTSCTLSGSNYGVHYSNAFTFTTCTLSGNYAGVHSASGLTFTTCTLSGNTYGVYSSSGHTFTTCTLSGNSCGVQYGSGHTFTTCTLSGNSTGVAYGSGHTLTTCTLSGNNYGVQYGSGYTLTTCTLSGNSYGVTYGSGYLFWGCIMSGNTQDFYAVGSALAYNCQFNSGIEHALYTTRAVWDYVESRDHDGTLNAFRAWAGRGGIVNSNVVTVPSGKTISYQFLPESATYPVFKQTRTLVEPGQTLIVHWWLRKDVAMAYLPRAQIIDVFADPLVDNVSAPLAQAVMTDSVNTWEQGIISWRNAGTTARLVYIRTQGKNAANNIYTLTEAYSVWQAVQR